MFDFNLGIQFFKGAPLCVLLTVSNFLTGHTWLLCCNLGSLGLDSLRLKFALIRIL